MSTQFKPLADRVLIEPAPIETKTASGIIIPDNVAEKPDQGTVLAIGAGRRTPEGSLVPMEVKVNEQDIVDYLEN